MKKYSFLSGILISFVLHSIGQTTTTYWPNKIKKSEGMLTDSVKMGPWMSWYENGVLQDSGSYVPLSSNNLIIYVNLDELAMYKVDTLQIKSEELKQQKETKSGNWILYDETGNLIEAGTYLPIAFISIDFIEALDGNINYVYATPAPIKTGNWKYYENGKLTIEQIHVYGISSGFGNRTEYFESGKKKTQGFYDENHARWTGVVKDWNEKGKLIKEYTYDQNGNITQKINY